MSQSECWGHLLRLPRCGLPDLVDGCRLQCQRMVWSTSVKLAVVWNLSRSTKVSKSECWGTMALCSVDYRDAAYR